MNKIFKESSGLDIHGILNPGPVFWNLSVAALYEQAVNRGEGIIAEGGSLVCLTGQHTGRSPNDKFIVREPSSEQHVSWGAINRPLEVEKFEALNRKVLSHLQGRALFVRDCFAGADPDHRFPIRVITETAWHNLFARHMFIPGEVIDRPGNYQPEFTVINVPSCDADPLVHGTNSEVFIVLNFAKRLVLIGGTSYAGEIKKSIFTVMNYLLPLRKVMPMHCSANVGTDNDSALFFGLSGTGKTTLSSDPERHLIGDDEHGWSDRGIFNFEGGCYAKMINLSAEAEPQIFATSQKFGTILENVAMDPITRKLDLNDESLTENTRGAYPISFIEGSIPSGQGPAPLNIVMLTADAFGVLPPIARLTPAAATYHFLSGYTAKVAGTEKGVTEPKATFSTCFGAPFMVWHPSVYAKLLGKRVAANDTKVWLVNTGWTGGPYGVGRRMKISQTRAMIKAALSGTLDDVQYEADRVFNIEVPLSCPGVSAQTLRPRGTWPHATDYDAQAVRLAEMFSLNFLAFEEMTEPEIKAAGPKT